MTKQPELTKKDSTKASPTVPTSYNRQIVLILFAAVLAIYLRMIAPGLLSGDSGEFQFAAWRLGLAHATGYPLYLLLGWLWQHLLALVRIDPATSLNAMSAVIGATAVALFFYLLDKWLPGNALLRRLTAIFAALYFAFNPTFWSQNLIAEVYTLHLLLIMLILSQFGKRSGDGENAHHASPITVALLFGLSLTHHATTLFLVPGALVALTLAAPGWWKSGRTLAGCVVAALVPLLLYFYVPLRSGIDASPWYYLRLGDETISLYVGGWQGFVNFISGRSISVGFKTFSEAMATLPTAWTLWKLHFGWIGLALIIVGLVALFRSRNWVIFSLTLPFALILQLFNLFYNIGDILVYYIPLYLVAVVWMAFGVVAIGEMGRWRVSEKGRKGDKGTRKQEEDSPRNTQYAGIVIVLLLFLLPIQYYRDYEPVLNQSEQDSARTMWQAILEAKPESNAILVSNDRNEIVPLYYLQSVENFATSLTGLFPLITPDPSFVDVAATVERALQSDQPVYLIKPMPGLEARFDLAAANPPLVRVLGPSISQPPQVAVGQALGTLTLLGYDWQQNGDVVQVDLHWQPSEKLPVKYTTTVQLFDEAGEKIAQDLDRPPGGDYYPTTLWKAGEQLLDRHALRLSPGKKAVRLLVGMYDPVTMNSLGEPITLDLK